jgi:hypothetical protein
VSSLEGGKGDGQILPGPGPTRAGRRYNTHSIRDEFLQSSSEGFRRKFAMQSQSAVLGERLGQGKGVQLDISTPMGESFENRSDDVPGTKNLCVSRAGIG